MKINLYDYLKALDDDNDLKIVFSNPKSISTHNIKKMIIVNSQLEFFKDNKAFHKQFSSFKQCLNYLHEEKSLYYFKQIDFISCESTTKVLVNKKNNITITKNKNVLKTNFIDKSFYKSGSYSLLLDNLQMMGLDGIVYPAKMKKLKQINKFIEFIDSIKGELSQSPTIIDYGCGKSYLTFAVYEYLKINGYSPLIIGIDLKADVIDYCQNLAKQLNYNMNFIHMDITEFNYEKTVDMVISLHACDIATDYALYGAIRAKAKVILSVPCCHKEVNRQLPKDFNEFCTYGFVKEKYATMLTDIIRAKCLNTVGYKVNLQEFIHESQTPKNTLIKAVYSGHVSNEQSLKKILDSYNLDQQLWTLMQNNL